MISEYIEKFKLDSKTKKVSPPFYLRYILFYHSFSRHMKAKLETAIM